MCFYKRNIKKINRQIEKLRIKLVHYKSQFYEQQPSHNKKYYERSIERTKKRIEKIKIKLEHYKNQLYKQQIYYEKRYQKKCTNK